MSVSVRTLPRRRTSRTERWVPLAYVALALIGALALLPSALRPPREQPTASGAFSPDAPPDKNQAGVFSSFHQASSGTAGGVTETAATTTTALQQQQQTKPTKRVPNACPYGFGQPARQIESVYAPPCAPAFSGDNGGATAKGVTGSQINQCFVMALTGAGDDGPVPTEAAPGQSGVTRTYRVFQAYFNSRYQFYGRHLQFYYVGGDSSETGAQQERDRGVKADETDHCFSAIQETDTNSIDELTRRGIVTYTLAQVPESFFQSKDPNLWSFTPAGSQAIRLGVEYICKRLAGKTPKFTSGDTVNFDPTKPRTFGLIVYNLPEYDDPGTKASQLLEQECGIKPAAVATYDLTGSAAGTEGLSAAVTTMQVNHVSTIFYLGDLISAVVFTQNAASNHYYPEWFIPGFGGVDTGHIGRDYDSSEWAHAFGFSFYEIPKPIEETECYKAYHEIDPNNDPNDGMCTYMWGNMVQLFAAIQQAGPDLTVPNLKKALFGLPHLPPDPPWHMAGGYSADQHTYPSYVAEIYWDPNAIGSDGQKGSYRFTNGGKRYTYGEWPSGDPQLFDGSGFSLAP